MADLDVAIDEWVREGEEGQLVVTGWALIATYERLDDPSNSYYRQAVQAHQAPHVSEGLAAKLHRDHTEWSECD